AGVPVGVLMGPVIPALTDHEMPSIIAEAVAAGASFAGYVPLRLPHGLKALFEDWLVQHFPDRKEKILNRIREMRGGKLNDGNFGSRMEGQGVFAEQMAKIFEVSCRKAGLKEDARPPLSASSFCVPKKTEAQLNLFEP
ncbi:MAG: radical SAM protein, partial [Verrucomicrobiales bacterium]